jgi:HEAT repeat protein
VLFDLLGDREAAAFFARMGTAAYGERESGHTGNFFNVFWAMPGVSRCGPLATAAYLKEQDWYYDLARGWDGRMLYQPTPGDWGGDSYDGWDCTGAYMLVYALPLKRIVLTGRKPSVVPALSRDEVAETIAAGRDFTYWTEKTCYDPKKSDELFVALSSWSPAVRKRAAQALGRREGDFVPRLLELLGGTKPDARYGACEALGCLGPKADAAAPQVRKLLTDPDPWLRFLAAEALVRMGPEIRKAVIPDLLRAASLKNPADRRDRVQGALAEALFTPGPGKREPKSILSSSLDGVDRPLLYAAMRDLLKNEDGRIRGLVAPVYRMLSPEDAAALMPDIVTAIRKPAPSGEMFAYGIRFAGLDLLARLRIREGMAMCVDLMNEFRWGRDLDRCVEPLFKYGGAARELLPRLRETRQAIVDKDKDWEKKDNEQRKGIYALDKLIPKIEGDAQPPSLRSMEDFMRAPAAAK